MKNALTAIVLLAAMASAQAQEQQQEPPLCAKGVQYLQKLRSTGMREDSVLYYLPRAKQICTEPDVPVTEEEYYRQKELERQRREEEQRKRPVVQPIRLWN